LKRLARSERQSLFAILVKEERFYDLESRKILERMKTDDTMRSFEGKVLGPTLAIRVSMGQWGHRDTKG
jgi:hypothetical protein